MSREKKGICKIHINIDMRMRACRGRKKVYIKCLYTQIGVRVHVAGEKSIYQVCIEIDRRTRACRGRKKYVSSMYKR